MKRIELSTYGLRVWHPTPTPHVNRLTCASTQGNEIFTTVSVLPAVISAVTEVDLVEVLPTAILTRSIGWI